MRQGSNGRRGRGRGSGRKPQNNRNQSFDSNGPSGRIRGTASQLHEKYLTQARDASASDDRITAENCYQHADHYYRIVLASQTPPEPAAEDSAGVDGDDGGQRQYGRDQRDGREQRSRDGNGRDGNNRGQGQRRRLNGNGHDADTDQADEQAAHTQTEEDRDDDRSNDDRSGGDRRPDQERVTENRTRRRSRDVRDAEVSSVESEAGNAEAASPAEDAAVDVEESVSEAPRERRRTRRTSTKAVEGAVADDAELKRALGGPIETPAVSPVDDSDAPGADVQGADTEPEEVVEKPRRRRRPPSTRVSD